MFAKLYIAKIWIDAGGSCWEHFSFIAIYSVIMRPLANHANQYRYAYDRNPNGHQATLATEYLIF